MKNKILAPQTKIKVEMRGLTSAASNALDGGLGTDNTKPSVSCAQRNKVPLRGSELASILGK